MYGLIGKITAKSGQRDELIRVLLEGTAEMPGCLSYIVAKDTEDENIIWITEAWESEESHKSSLSLSSVQDALTKGRPLIAEFTQQAQTEVIGGHGLDSAE
ncbi:MAG: antibiotic biosynthesis monooxygenase [Candidatus Marinimicrobia bacterium]|nr:antibiotic biosynthesis monooxygenase [Candidatus Neomarinimicrobiota bacterium]